MQAQTLRFAKVFMRDRRQRYRSVKPGAPRFPPFLKLAGRCDPGRAFCENGQSRQSRSPHDGKRPIQRLLTMQSLRNNP
jgi:hypothetical protein